MFSKLKCSGIGHYTFWSTVRLHDVCLFWNQVRRLKEFGVTKGELTRYMDALIKDSEQLAAMVDSVPSVDNLEFIMESDALGHTIMDQRQGHESLVAVAETVTLEEVTSFNYPMLIVRSSQQFVSSDANYLWLLQVNSIGAEVLEFISEFGKPTAPLPAAIVACVPSKVHTDGVGETEFKIYPHEITDAILAGLEEPIHAEPEVCLQKS